MRKKLKTICVIPARGGSKGLPGKNIKVFNGKPLIAWPIIAAKACKKIDEVVVTTDSSDIAEKAQNLKNLAYGKVNKFIHDDVGFNYRLPNMSAAIGLAQLENIDEVFLQKEIPKPKKS